MGRAAADFCEEYDGFVHGKLNVYKNRFTEPLNGKHTFFLEYLEKAEIYDNYFDAEFEIVSDKCGIISENDNKIT